MSSFRLEFDGSIQILIFSGYLDNSFKKHVDQFISTQQNVSGASWILDFEVAENMNSFGVSAIQNLCDAAEDTNCKLALCSIVSADIREILNIAAILKRCHPNIHPTRGQAIHAMQEGGSTNA